MMPSSYHGTHTSLYKTLSDDTIQHIEHAIWLKITGQTGAARAIFENELRLLGNVPIVVIEQTDLELDAGRWGRAWRILDSALKHLKETGANLDLPENRLIALIRAMTGIRHRGDVDSSAVEIERTRQWLQDVPVADYTDVQTSCVRRYVIAYLFTKLSSKYDNPEAEYIPKSNANADLSEPKAAWNGLHDLRRSLTARGMFNEANLLFRVELNRSVPTQRAPVAEDFLTAIAELPTSRGKDYIDAAVRLQWVTTHLQLRNNSRAMEELKKSEASFNSWCIEFDIPDKDTVPHSAGICLEKLEFLSDYAQKLDWAEKFSHEMERIGSSKTGMCLSTAADSARALYESTNEEKYLAKFFDLHKRLEHFDENVSEDICDLVRHRNSLIAFTIERVVDRQKSLEWIDGFLERYPHFTSPGELESLHTRRALLLRSLRRLEEAQQAEEMATELNGKGPLIGKWLHLSFNKILAPSTSMNHSSQYDPEDDEEEFNFASFWAPIVGNQKKQANTVVQLLHDWLIEDVVSGHITVEKFRKMMDITKSEVTDSDLHGPKWRALITKMKNEKPGSIWSALFPADTDSETSQVIRRELIINWLSYPPQGQRNKRIFCLLMLRDSRQRYFSDKPLWDLLVIELEHLLELYSKLPGHIRETCRSYVSSWYSSLALAHEVQLGDAPDARDPNMYVVLLKAEKYCELAVAELRKTPYPTMLALQQRLGAQICVRKIRRLEQQLREPSQAYQVNQHAVQLEQEIQQERIMLPQQADRVTAPSLTVNPMEIAKEISKIRQIGLEKIKEADKIYTDSELESWFYGLESINDRQGIAKFYNSFRTVHLAITLLLMEVGEISQETITEIWSWVQKSKARSLSRTIGRRSNIPPGLMNEILASTDALPIYEEMLDLQKRIENAESNARFDLRQQLDANRRRMKKNALLRHLIELREGTPLELSDIAAIEKGVGNRNSIALIDWYHLPPYVDIVNKMLLFTARADSAPTMDVLTTKLEHSHMWQAEYLQPKNGEALRDIQARHSFNHLLNGLVAPLSYRTKEDDVLVLCPSTVFLHRLPLHALFLKTSPLGERDVFSPLIHRNPVVYIHSHSLLRSCFSTTEHARYSPASILPQFLSGISESHEEGYTAGRSCIRDLAQVFDSSPMIDESASKSQFLGMAKQSRLLHLQAHCGWNPENPLDHHVQFPSLEGAQGPEELKLTAREIFQMRLLPGTHVTMMACQGGLTDVQQGDEVMGLVPALLYSGASSTISTLWPIDDYDGAAFSRLFFQNLIDQCEGQKLDELSTDDMTKDAPMKENKKKRTSFVDIARALQNAVKDMDGDLNRPLYSWASFILHGFWQLPLSNDDVQWLAERDAETLELPLEEMQRLRMMD